MTMGRDDGKVRNLVVDGSREGAGWLRGGKQSIGMQGDCSCQSVEPANHFHTRVAYTIRLCHRGELHPCMLLPSRCSWMQNGSAERLMISAEG